MLMFIEINEFLYLVSTNAVSHGERTRRLIVPGSGQAALFTRRAIAPEGKQSRHTKNRVQSFEVVLRSLRRVYDGVAERHGRRTAGAPKALAVALSFCRLLGLGCPKQAFAKIATPRVDFKGKSTLDSDCKRTVSKSAEEKTVYRTIFMSIITI
jgi:hypothetical protein